MHFLCLHGIGTNSKLYFCTERKQGALRYALGPEHTYDFVEGEIDHPMEPGVASLSAPGDTFHAYFDPQSGRAMLAALEDLDSLVAEAEPPYDGVLGFSHGCSLAATMLTRPRLQGAEETTPFKLAVFLCAGMAADHDSLLQRDLIEKLRSVLGNNKRIKIPTAHIYAENDEACPGQGALLQSLCAENAYAAVHSLGHRIPGATEKKELEAAALAIKRAIADAQRTP
ncbi:serine hydrolase FSH [Apiospora phragmitis]|uniref:Serine hydrolase FSH n=1 Tax=Apiospora phragmitis TaxID=2905665 RepID=A0ABR1VH86_9PEZI